MNIGGYDFDDFGGKEQELPLDDGEDMFAEIDH